MRDDGAGGCITKTRRLERCMRMMRHWLFLACAVPAIGLFQADSASAFVRFGRAAMPARSFAARPMPMGQQGGPSRSFATLRNHGFSHPSGQPFQQGGFRGAGGRQGPGFPHGVQHGPTQHGPAQHGQPHGATAGGGRPQPHGPAQMRNNPIQARNPPPAAVNAIARNGLPHRPMLGETGFTGVPPRGETRFVSHEMIVHVGPEVSPQALDATARRLGLTPVATQNLALSGGRLIHYRVPRGDVADTIRTLEAEKIGIAQPNYLFQLQEDIHATGLPPKGDSKSEFKGDPAQYVIDKLHLHEAHAIASGASVTVAVIDSQIDAAHPDLSGSIAAQYDAVTGGDKPDEHGTGMTGAIAAHRRLLGVAPRARILAIHAFSPDAQHPQQATTQSIVAGIDWAIARGARVINMSFAGPYDPLLQLALKKARDKGVILIAAAGNMGPQSPPLYPAADENVIAVTAVDDKDKLMPQANQGPHVALAAPGVNVLEAAPRASYNFTTGTSVAAAHVSGVVALILERNPGIDVPTLEDALYTTARDLGAAGRDPMYGYGLVDPFGALNVLEAKAMARNRPPDTTASANPRALLTGATALRGTASPKPPPGAAELVSGAPAGPIGPATPRVSANAPAGGTTGGQAITGQVPLGQAATSQLTTGMVNGRLPPQKPATPAALPPADADVSPATIERKRQSCRNDGAGRGVQASEMADFVEVCVSEARLACLRQVLAQRVHGPERRDFLNRCLRGS
jgi:subtilisin family serine protease